MGLGRIRRGFASSGKACYGKYWRGLERNDSVWLGVIRQCRVVSGAAWFGRVWYGYL